MFVDPGIHFLVDPLNKKDEYPLPGQPSTGYIETPEETGAPPEPVNGFVDSYGLHE